MYVHWLGWLCLFILIFALITIDIVGHVRKPHAPSMKEAVSWTVAYVALALLFGVVIWWVYGGQFAGEYYAGWVTEKALSMDNLFVFMLILNSFRVPRDYQQKALLSGIIIALVLRLIFILLGSAIISRFSWIFVFFGLWLLWTAVSQVRKGTNGHEADDKEYKENRFITLIRNVFPVTDGYTNDHFVLRHGGKTFITPLLLVVFALGSADLIFAFDSIPAIFGLTEEPFLVFACNALALLGLRQMFFVIDGLLERLVYLNYGLAAILAFIGVKLIFHALHENSLSFINGGQSMTWAPEIGTGPSLIVIAGILVITVIASLIASRSSGNNWKPTSEGPIQTAQ